MIPTALLGRIGPWQKSHSENCVGGCAPDTGHVYRLPGAPTRVPELVGEGRRHESAGDRNKFPPWRPLAGQLRVVGSLPTECVCAGRRQGDVKFPQPRRNEGDPGRGVGDTEFNNTRLVQAKASACLCQEGRGERSWTGQMKGRGRHACQPHQTAGVVYSLRIRGQLSENASKLHV